MRRNAMLTPHCAKSDLRPRRRRWYQFSLRTLVLVMVVVGCGCAAIGVLVKHESDQRQLVAALQKSGWEVTVGEPQSA